MSPAYPLAQWKIKNLFLSFIFLTLFISYVEAEVSSPWADRWKDVHIRSYQSVEISNVTQKGFDFYYDEGIGMNGQSIYGKALLHQSHNNKQTAEGIKEHQGTKFTLTTHKNPLLNTLKITSNKLFEDLSLIPLAAPIYYKTSFNCSLAQTTTEIALCSNELLASLDIQLGKNYKLARKNLKKSEKKLLRKSQKAWIDMRDKSCTTKGKANISCLEKSYAKRILELSMYPKSLMREGISFSESEKNNASFSQSTNTFINAYVLNGEFGDFDLRKNYKSGKHLNYKGCYVPNPTRGHDPARSFCAYQVFIGLYPPNKLIIAQSKGFWDKKIIITGPKGLRSKKQLPKEMKTWLKQFNYPIYFKDIFPWKYE